MISITAMNELSEREKNNIPIRVGVVGTGFIGRGLINQISLMKGIKTTVVATRTLDKAIKVLTNNQVAYRHCINEYELRKTIHSEQIGIVSDPMLLPTADIDIIVDCTGDIEFGAALGVKTIENDKHFISNPEMDVTVGPVLSKMAADKGVIYSGADGDEPGVIMNLYHHVSSLGLDIVAAGKFKGYHNCYATPLAVKPWADKLAQNPYKIASFADGTKMNIEMALVANATGLIPDIRGMHCPTTTLDRVSDVLKLREQGGILSSSGVIEVVMGVQPSGGVFVVATTSNSQIKKDLQYYKMGNGPNYLFYRPYHLCAVEMGTGIISAVLNGEPTICPKHTPVADVLTVAKKDLRTGEVLDDIGGYSFYGVVDRAITVKEKKFLPIGLACKARMIRSVKAGTPITLDDVEVNDHSLVWKLRQRYEKMV